MRIFSSSLVQVEYTGKVPKSSRANQDPIPEHAWEPDTWDDRLYIWPPVLGLEI
jgi:hypothetical protein